MKFPSLDCGLWLGSICLERGCCSYTKRTHTFARTKAKRNQHTCNIYIMNERNKQWVHDDMVVFIYGQKGNCKQVFDVASELLLLLCGECFTSSLADGALWFKQRGLNKHTQNTPISNINMYVYIYILSSLAI